jgi:hypothetical protein
MPIPVEVSRYSKSQPRSKIISTLTAVALLPVTAILVIEGKSRDARPGSACWPSPGAGSPILNTNQQYFFNQASARFQEVDSVSEAMAGESGPGLGSKFKAIAVKAIAVRCARRSRPSAAAVSA